MAVSGKGIASRFAAAALIGTAAYYAVWGGEYSTLDLLSLAEQRAAEEAALVEVRREADSLRILTSLLESDSATIEEVARERFGMIRQGEMLYRFVEVPADSIP